MKFVDAIRRNLQKLFVKLLFAWKNNIHDAIIIKVWILRKTVEVYRYERA